jgi:hypothetical protein
MGVTSQPQILPKPKSEALRLTNDVRMSVFWCCDYFAAARKMLENADFSFVRVALATVLLRV